MSLELMHIFYMMMICHLWLEMLNDNRVARADIKAIRLDALAKEHLQSLFVANFDMCVHLDALATPEIIQVLLAEPLLGRLCVELVLSLEHYALVVLHKLRYLIVAGHSSTKEAILLPCLLLFIVHKLVAEFFFSAYRWMMAVHQVLIDFFSLKLCLFSLTHGLPDLLAI